MPKRITVIGDIMLDKYDYCLNRDNPESSAPCYKVIKTEYKPGGAGNVAANLATLDSEVNLISVIGNDPNSEVLLKVLSEFDINAFLIPDNERPTIIKERILSFTDKRYHYRKDTEKTCEIKESHVSEIIEKARGSDLIIVSDYNKGNISQKLMNELAKLKILTIVDPKPEHKEFFRNVFVITPNIKEIKEMAKIENELEAASKIGKELKTNIILTRSQEGLSFFGLNGERFDFPTEAQEVFDVTGAGDTVVATFAHFYLKGLPLKECLRLANVAAGISVGHPGCYQVKEKEILETAEKLNCTFHGG